MPVACLQRLWPKEDRPLHTGAYGYGHSSCCWGMVCTSFPFGCTPSPLHEPSPLCLHFLSLACTVPLGPPVCSQPASAILDNLELPLHQLLHCHCCYLCSPHCLPHVLSRPPIPKSCVSRENSDCHVHAVHEVLDACTSARVMWLDSVNVLQVGSGHGAGIHCAIWLGLDQHGNCYQLPGACCCWSDLWRGPLGCS